MLSAEESRLMTICSLCNQQCVEPRTLPCLHSFCLQCLKKSHLQPFIDPGIHCAVCGDKYDGRLSDLPLNSFIQKLVKVSQIADAVESRKTPCDVCLQDDLGPSSAVMATHYCLNCAESLCDKCSVMHGRLKSSRLHRVVQFGTDLTAQDALEPVSQCNQHVDEPLKLYCNDCARCICFLCYAEYHTGHHCQVAMGHLLYHTI